MNTTEIKSLYESFVMPTYAPEIALVRGEGCRVWDAEDNEYMDFIAGIAVVSVGHCHPALVRAMREQAGKLMHVSNLYFNELQPQLARVISERSLGGKCFFCNSGAEANEGLIKLARKWGHDAGRHEVITFSNSFHGRTLATLTATGQDKVKKGFDPLPAGFRQATLNDIESVGIALNDQTAAVLVEAVQCEGGIRIADHEFLQNLRTLCDEAGVLLLCDEVQCGMGRSGNWFGYEASGIRPDAIAMAKGLGGGFPIGAISASPEFSDILTVGSHATTFGGTPLACAAGIQVFQIIEEEGLLAQARDLGAAFVEGLTPLCKQYEWVAEARGVGFMIGLELTKEALGLQQILAEKGLLSLATANTVIRFVPPMTVSEQEIKEAISRIHDACAEFQKANEESHGADII